MSELFGPLLTWLHTVFVAQFDAWIVLGFVAQALFMMRFLVQWVASERQGESVIPVSFWYWSIAGSVLMCVYFIFRRDPIGILAYLPNSLIYIRNLMLIRKRKFAFTAAAPSQHPREVD